jgi:anti-sigma B factor antagonist
VRRVELKVVSRVQGAHAVVSVHGEIDLYTAPRLHAALDRVLAAGGPVRVTVDLTGVEFCDSTGVNVLLAAHHRARDSGGDLELAGLRPPITKILQVTGLDSVFRVVRDPAGVAGS